LDIQNNIQKSRGLADVKRAASPQQKKSLKGVKKIMAKWKIIIAVVLAFVLLAGAAGAVYYFGFHNREQTKIEDETPDNAAVLEALQRIIGLLENGVENQSSVNENIISRFGELSERIENDKQDIDGIITELDGIFAALVSMETEIEALENYDDTEIYGLYNSVLGSLSNLIRDKDILAISHSDLVKLYEGLQAVVNGLKNDLQNTNFDLETVKTDIQTFKQAVVSLFSDYMEISASLDNALTLINNLTTDFDIFRADFTALNNTVSEILNTLAALNSCECYGMLTALQSDISEIQNRLNQHDSALQALQNAVDGLISGGSAMDGRIGNIESVLSALENTVSYLAGELAHLQNGNCNCPDYSYIIADMQWRVNELENVLYPLNIMLYDYPMLHVRVNALEWDFYILQDRLSALETRIDELQNNKPVEILNAPLIYNPYNYQDNIFYIPYEIAWQLQEKDTFKITAGVILDGDIFVTRIIELRLFGLWEYPVIAAIDGISVLGVEWLMAIGLSEYGGEYSLQFEMAASYELLSIMEMRILSIEYIKGANI